MGMIDGWTETSNTFGCYVITYYYEYDPTLSTPFHAKAMAYRFGFARSAISIKLTSSGNITMILPRVNRAI
jgi:hypothetical protein